MKAINLNGKNFEITGERGDFFICKDSKGKVKMFAKKEVEVIEIESMPKTKVYKQSTSSFKAHDYGREKTVIIDMAQNNPYSLTQFSDHENATEIVKSIVAQARRKMDMSEKQAYMIAKFAEENNINI